MAFLGSPPESPAFQNMAFLILSEYRHFPSAAPAVEKTMESLAGSIWGWQGAACGTVSQVPTPNWPYRACKEFTILLLGCPPCDLNCHFKISALALNPALEQPSPAQPQAFLLHLGFPGSWQPTWRQAADYGITYC